MVEPRIPRHLLLLGLASVLVHLAAINQYGYFRDELYYLASTSHLDFGYVDHPPLSIWILAVIRVLLGDSLIALRIVPVLAGAAVVIMTGLMARELGGGRFAQALAATAVLVSPVHIGNTRYYSMNAFDLLLWALAGWILIRVLASGDRRLWLLLGTVLGLGLANKISVLWLGAGLAVGLLLTSHRKALLTRGPWVAGAISAALFLPYVIWQVRHDWATLEFMRNATQEKMVRTGLLEAIREQVLVMNPAVAPIWIAGLIWSLFSKEGARWRILGFIYLTVFAILAASGTSRGSYLAPAYPFLLAPGALALERILASPRLAWARAAAFALPVAVGAVFLPFAVPILPVDSFIRYQHAIGLTPRQQERTSVAELPQYYADMFGWEEMARKAADAYHGLTPQEQARCLFFGQNYGEAGALDVLGPRFGLPPGRVLSGHNSYWIWGTREMAGEVAIILGSNYEDNSEFFEQVEQVGTIRCERCMPYERDLPVFVGRRPKATLANVWPQLKMFI
jgi:hypothetical protein